MSELQKPMKPLQQSAVIRVKSWRVTLHLLLKESVSDYSKIFIQARTSVRNLELSQENTNYFLVYATEINCKKKD